MSEDANTVEGRLAELMEGAEVRIDGYRLSENDRSKVIAALRENDRLRAELAAERERCAKIVEAKADKSVLAFAGCVAAAIRKGEP